MELSKTASALGIYKYNADQPHGDLISRFYSLMLSQLAAFGISVTYIGADGHGYSGKFAKIGGSAHDKLLRTRFADVTGLTLVANPSGSDAPAYDGFASAAFGYAAASRELLICVIVNESFLKFSSAPYDALLRSLINLSRWDFGYGFASSVEKKPDFHILGIDDGTLSPDEYKSLCNWYSTLPNDRTRLLRDVYPYNIVNEMQLDAKVSDGITLRGVAQSQPGCSLRKLTDYGLYLWQVSEPERVRQLIAGSSVLVS